MLLVEDHPGMTASIKWMFRLEAPHISLTTVADLPAAREKFAEGGFDAVITDGNLGGGNSGPFIEDLRAQDPELPIVPHSADETANR